MEKEKLFQLFEVEFGISREEFLNGGSKPKFAEIRHGICYVMDRLGIPQEEISKTVGKHRTTVLYSISTAYDIIYTYPEYRKKIQRILQRLQRKMIYLASPYINDPEGNYQKVREKTKELLEQGINVYSPIIYGHHLTQKFNWYAFDLEILRICDELWIYQLPHWDISYGVKLEVEEAKKLNIKIKYLDIDGKIIEKLP